MLINTFLDTEDFVHLYYPEDEPAAAQGCGANARMAPKYPPRPPSPEYKQVAAASEMTERERYRAPPPPEPPPHRVRASDLYPRLRTQYDEPGLDAGFTPICGEFVQWVGRTADGGTIAMSNYRLHLQPRRRSSNGASVPLRLIDALEIRDLLCLIILCKHGRQLKCTFSTGDQCMEWWRRLNTALAPMGSLQETFAAAYAAWAKEQPPSSVHRALMRASHAPHRHWFGPEVERLGFTTKGAWRVTAANADYKLCPSYPPLLVVPASICDEDLDSVARFRAMRRIPTVVWRHGGTGAVIARSSQPEVGWLGWRSAEDERLLAAFVAACAHDRGTSAGPPPAKQPKLLIVDARSYASAVTNRARGGGCECQQYYPLADIQFMCLPNIHNVRRSFHQMRALIADPADQANWHSSLERTLWLQYVAGVARAGGVAARAAAAGRPVLVHCSDGWDRTPQIVAAAQLILDPHYRTLEGFRVLIEREWLDFGHKFGDRCGHQFGPEDPNERSPIFLQWLDVVYQMMVQYPCSFEFNEAYLIKLATHVHSCMFGTFLCNSGRERADSRAADAAHVWQLLRAPAYRNHLYAPHSPDQMIWPDSSVRAMQLWAGMYCGERPARDAPTDPRPPPPAAHPPPANGLMTKTRSCDNLLNEGEKRTAQRRCSDPSLAPDVMKLSLVVNGNGSSERRECRGLTDSCVDELPAGNTGNTGNTLPPLATLPALADTPTLALNDDDHDQVDGLAEQFESDHPRDLASNSSSLERELAAPLPLTVPIPPPHTAPVPLPLPAPPALPPLPPLPHPPASPDEPAVFLGDAYTDVIGMADAARDVGRTRNISITWRSISESSNQSSTGFDIPETSPQTGGGGAHEPSPDNHNCTDGDLANHNVLTHLTNHNRNTISNGAVNGLDDIANKFLEVDLNVCGSGSGSGSGGGECSGSCSAGAEGEGEAEGSSSGASSESEGEGARASQLTLCPASPRRAPCCACARRPRHHHTHNHTHAHTHTHSVVQNNHAARNASAGDGVDVEASNAWWGGTESNGSGVRCVCGAGARTAADSLDGLPPVADPLQDRLHQIILYQKKVVEELSGQLREAREALRRASPPTRPAPHPAAAPAAAEHSQSAGTASAGTNGHGPGHGSGSSSGAASGSSSGSGSGSEVEVGEEARGVVWVPDSAAPRCQYCRNHFWLARRRHHCRRCGGIFCGSCSEMSAWGECGAVRVCRRCRALR